MQKEKIGSTGIKEIIKNDPWMMRVLRIIKDLNLPDSWAAAGFVRNKVWDSLHGYERQEVSDVDIIYFDPSNTDEVKEKEIETELRELAPDIPWSVKNQARMHLKNGEQPYASSEDAISRWVETPTCIGVRLNEKDEIELLAPHGIDDLTNLIVRPSPKFRRDVQIYLDRVNSKGWKEKWPRLKIIYPEVNQNDK